MTADTRPNAGAWNENIPPETRRCIPTQVAPTRAHGLKRRQGQPRPAGVAPNAGAWIETPTSVLRMADDSVAPHAVNQCFQRSEAGPQREWGLSPPSAPSQERDGTRRGVRHTGCIERMVTLR